MMAEGTCRDLGESCTLKRLPEVTKPLTPTEGTSVLGVKAVLLQYLLELLTSLLTSH